MPKITVIIPTYNWCSVLPFSIGSALAQTWTDFELLVVGDGCTDGSQALVESMSDPRVRWINLERNTGDSAAPSNRGCEEAQGEWIAYLGHDDLWLPGHLESLFSTVQTGCDMAYGIAICYLEDAICGALPQFFENYRRPMAIAPASVMHRRALWEKVGGWRGRYEVRAAMDYDLWQRFHEAGAVMRFLPEISAVKFPAVLRKDVYHTTPSGPQQRLLSRMRNEPDFAAMEKEKLMAWLQEAYGEPPRLGGALRMLRSALIMRLKLGERLRLRKGRQVDAFRRFKGLR
ncbi:MAG: glycosyltransferase family 2 protein [Chthoniobacterales bacterium]